MLEKGLRRPVARTESGGGGEAAVVGDEVRGAEGGRDFCHIRLRRPGYRLVTLPCFRSESYHFPLGFLCQYLNFGMRALERPIE